MLNKLIFIVGPTAVGKSKTAFLLAQKIDAEIISCDSMQIYEEIEIVSDKASVEMRRQIPHHLVDCVSVEEEFDVARFNQLTMNAIEDIIARGRTPIVVGGSGMYMQILLDGIFKSGEKNEELRSELQQEAKEFGTESIYQKLEKLDPDAVENIHPNDQKRIIRALEVCLTEGKPISQLQKNREGLWNKYDIKLIGLNRDREKLYAIINQRVDEMFEKGVVEEVKSLENLKLSYSAQRIIGIQEVRGFLKGEWDLEAAKEKMKMNTRRFAKRQLTWFRKEKRIQWIEIQEGDTVEDVIREIEKIIQL